MYQRKKPIHGNLEDAVTPEDRNGLSGKGNDEADLEASKGA